MRLIREKYKGKNLISMQFIVILFIMFIIDVPCLYIETHGRYEGDFCEDNDGQIGNCTNIRLCDHAARIIRLGGRPKICGFTANDPMVCCSIESQNRGSIEENKGLPKIGSKAYNACVIYNEMVCPSTHKKIRKPSFTEDRHARFGQFPYMALLGFGEEYQNARWWCAGSVISQRFILTAGHCTTDGTVAVSFIRVGFLRRSDKIHRNRLYRVQRIYKPPGFYPPQHYNDIALLYTDRKILFNALVRPACLYFPDEEYTFEYIIAGWGGPNFKELPSDVLRYAMVTRYSNEECNYLFSPKLPLRRLKYGFDTYTQMCCGHRTVHSDTCPGDSGGPLEVDSFQFPCLHTITGVTSFGDKCGLKGQPGVYTRVSAFLPWIESIVWPTTFK